MMERWETRATATIPGPRRPALAGVSWHTETFSQNPNANALRWGTLYNFRVQQTSPPVLMNATIGFFKTGAPIVVPVLGPSQCQTSPTPTPSPTVPPTVTPSPTFDPPPTPTATATATASPTVCGELLGENFDTVTAPALPSGWSSSDWVTSTVDPDSAPNCAFVDAPAFLSDRRLDSIGLLIISTSPSISFRNNFNLESSGGEFLDGGVLEISSPNINGGAFTDVTDPAVGGSFFFGGYTGTIGNNFGNPLAGRMAWSGDSVGYVNTEVNLGPNLNGQTIRLRFRMGSDTAGSTNGFWRIDSLSFGGVCHTVFPTPTPSATATATPPPSPTPNPTPTPSATPSPTAAPAQALNLSTRLRVETGKSSALIAGFIITANSSARNAGPSGARKTVAIRAVGPSLSQFGIPGVLADPVLELYSQAGELLQQNDNWQDDPEQAAQLTALGLPLQTPTESGMVASLSPGAYTAIVTGKNAGTGVALVEVYDTDPAGSLQLANVSTRGRVQAADNVMIGGFILGGGGATQLAIRGIGPSLPNFPFPLFPNLLADPFLALHDGNGAVLISNDDWQSDSAMAAQLSAHGLALQNPKESGIFVTLPPGIFTAILEEKDGGGGIGVVEIYNLGGAP